MSCMSAPASVMNVLIKVDVLRDDVFVSHFRLPSLIIFNKVPERKAYIIKVNPLPFETHNNPFK